MFFNFYKKLKKKPRIFSYEKIDFIFLSLEMKFTQFIALKIRVTLLTSIGIKTINFIFKLSKQILNLFQFHKISMSSKFLIVDKTY